MSPLLILSAAGIALGVAYILEKKLSLDQFHPATYVALIAGTSSIVSLPLLTYQFKVPHLWSYWLIVLVSVFAYGTGNLFSFKAYKLIDASEVGLIGRLNLVFTALIAILFLSEIYTPRSFLGLFLVFAGSSVIFFDKGKISLNRGVIYALIMALGYGLAALFDKIILQEFSPFTYVVVNNFLVSLMFLTFKEARKESLQLIKKHPLLVILTGILAAGSWVGFLFVLQSGSVSKVFPIFDSLSLVSTVGLGILFLKERNKLFQKIIGSALIIFGVFLLG